MLYSNQMELGLGSKMARRRAALTRRRTRLQRAQWWFKEMRRVVDGAFDWSKAPAARPEQVYINLEAKRS
jgi:hypothetical protein